MRRLVIVGEGPSPRYVGQEIKYPLYGETARRLSVAAGWAQSSHSPERAYVYLKQHALLVNLCRGRWRWDEARARAAGLQGTHREGIFVLLGRRVAGAFGHRGGYYKTRVREDGSAIAVVPHPSGLNRMWNEDPTWHRVGRVLCQAYAMSLHGWR